MKSNSPRKSWDRPASQAIESLEQLRASKINEVYVYTHSETKQIRQFFRNISKDAEDILDKTVKLENDLEAGRTILPYRRKTGPGPKRNRTAETSEPESVKCGVKKGTKRSEINTDGPPGQKPGPKPGSKRSVYNNDGSLGKKRVRNEVHIVRKKRMEMTGMRVFSSKFHKR